MDFLLEAQSHLLGKRNCRKPFPENFLVGARKLVAIQSTKMYCCSNQIFVTTMIKKKYQWDLIGILKTVPLKCQLNYHLSIYFNFSNSFISTFVDQQEFCCFIEYNNIKNNLILNINKKGNFYVNFESFIVECWMIDLGCKRNAEPVDINSWSIRGRSARLEYRWVSRFSRSDLSVDRDWIVHSLDCRSTNLMISNQRTRQVPFRASDVRSFLSIGNLPIAPIEESIVCIRN